MVCLVGVVCLVGGVCGGCVWWVELTVPLYHDLQQR